ncbi:hypothetical protein CWB58_13625 [Pseudoalteromonas sp. S201]|nr:hypothetical protein CWB58_13625 [Pseudoalteromonas sp. S201]
MFKFLPLLGFFNVFFSPLGMLSYLVVIKTYRIKFSLFDTLFLLYIMALLLVNILISDIAGTLTTFRFYFGFICFYLYFKSGAVFPAKGLFLALIILIPIEAFLINSLISPYNMPNFPDKEMTSHFNPGGYQRPYSFGGNSSVSSSILVILLSMLTISKITKYAGIVCVFIFSSGSGLMSLMLLSFLKRIKIIAISSIFIIFFLVFFSGQILEVVDSLGLKVNSKYMLFLVDFKLKQLSEHFYGFTFIHYLFGNIDSIKDGYGGDFGWLFFVLGYGFVSFFLLTTFILSKATKSTLIPILIALFATFHYPVIFFLPGQILLGYLMARKYRAET